MPAILTSVRAKVPPSSSKTIETVVEVGSLSVLKTSRMMTSVTMTARKMQSSSWKKNCSGRKMPWRAISIMPFDMRAPQRIPVAAIHMMTR